MTLADVPDWLEVVGIVVGIGCLAAAVFPRRWLPQGSGQAAGD